MYYQQKVHKRVILCPHDYVKYVRCVPRKLGGDLPC